jgi:CheY-like chemotaxis protein
MLRPRLDGVVVLVVEDDHDALDLMRAVLRHCGAVVLGASSAAAGVGILDIVQPTVLVSDIMMPGADGWWLVAEARRRGRLHGVPKIAVTAIELRAEEVREGGFDEYVRKPVDPDALCTVVEKLVLRARAA